MQAFWTHGNSAVLERETAEFEFVKNLGWGTVIRARKQTGIGGSMVVQSYFWVHLPLTNGVILNDRRLNLIRVFGLWTASAPIAHLIKVDVWDGPNRFEINPNRDNSDLAQRHCSLQQDKNMWSIPPRPVQFGLGLSLRFEITDTVEITIAGGGADFE